MRWACAILTVLVMLTVCSHRVRLGTTANLPAPALVGPRDQAVFTNHPRTVRFSWSRVPRAARYGIEIDCFGCCARGRWCSEEPGKSYTVADLTAITYTFDFWGDQKGRWRVWGIDARSRLGMKSAWSSFEFQAARENTSKPSPLGPPARRR
jgi:hypothetical protein